MLIRTRADKVILSFLLLAGVSSCIAEEDGYLYQRPSVGFSDGFKSVAAASTQSVGGFSQQSGAKPQAVFNGFQGFGQGSTSLSGKLSGLSQTGQYQGEQQYQRPSVSSTARPQSSFGSFQGFSGARPASGFSSTAPSVQYQIPSVSSPVISTVRPQSSFSGYQSIGQSSLQKPAVTTTTFSQFGQGSLQPAGQYQKPSVSITAKPAVAQATYLPPQVQQATVNVGRPQVSFQRFTGSSSTARPVITSAKPQINFSGFQGLGQSTVQRPAVTTTSFSQLGQAALNPAVSTGQYQRPSVSFTAKPAVAQAAYLQPQAQQATVNVGRPQVSFQGFTGLSSTARPVIASVKPQTSFGGFQGQSTAQKPAVTTTSFSQFGQAPLKPAVTTGQYQRPSISITAKPAVAQATYLPPQAQQATLNVGRPQVSFQGFTGLSSTARPVIASVKPQTSFGGFQGQSTAQKPAVTTTSFSQFGQAPLKPAVTTGQYQRPSISITAKPAVAQATYLPPQAQQATLNVGRPQVSFQGFTGSSSTARPVIASAKPQTSFSGFQGLGQSTVQRPAVTTTSFSQFGQAPLKPAVSTGQYQRPSVSITAKPAVVQATYLPPQAQQATLNVGRPQVSFQGFTGLSSTARPVIASVKPQTSFGGFQGQSTAQKPAVTTTSFSQFGQAPLKPAVATGQYQRPTVSITAKPAVAQATYLPPQAQQATLNVGRPQVSFQGFTGSSSTARPVIASAKPQTSFSGFQGLGQSTVQRPAVTTTSFSQFGQAPLKPAVGTGQYQRPSVSITAKPVLVQTSYLQPQSQQATLTVGKPQVSFQGFTGSSSTARPVIASAKPQISFSGLQGLGQSTVQKPAVTTTSFSQFGQAPLKPAVATGQYQRPSVSITAKPAVAQATYLPPQVQQATLNVGRPQVSFQGFTGLSSTARPVIASAKPQTSFGGFQGQSTAQKPAVTTTSFSQFGQAPLKPAVSTGQYQRPSVSITAKPAVAQATYLPPQAQQATLNVGRPQVSFQGFTGLSSTARPVIASVKPQTSFGGFQGQSTAQKPAVTTTSFSPFGQALLKPAVTTGQYQRPSISITAKPAVAQATYLPPQAQQATLNVGRPQVSFQGFTGSSSTARPVIASAKPQTSFSGFQGLGQSTVQRPAVTTTTFSQFGQSAVKPAVTTGQYQQPLVRPQLSSTASGQYQQQLIRPQLSSTVAPQSQQLPSRNVNLEYLPPVGAKIPSNAARSSGDSSAQFFDSAPLQSVFELTSATANQVVDAAQQHKVGRFVAPGAVDFNQDFTAVSSGLPTSTNQVTNEAQEHKVEQIGSKENLPTSAFQGQSLTYTLPQQSFFELASTTVNKVVDANQGQVVDGRSEVASLYTPHNSISQIETNQIAGDVHHRHKRDYGLQSALGSAQFGTLQANFGTANLAPTGFFNFQGNPVGPQQFRAQQPQIFQTVPTQQFQENQLIVLPDGSTIIQVSLPTVVSKGAEQRPAANTPVNRPLVTQIYKQSSISKPEHKTVDFTPINRQQQSQNQKQIQKPTSVQLGSSQLLGESSSVNTINYVSQSEPDSELQDPQPLNREEQQVRQLEEKADSDKEDYVVKTLQPGSNTGPHVNQRSDKEYNVFDYDQYSMDPEDNET